MQTRASANLCCRIVCMLLWLNDRIKECKIFHKFFLLLIKCVIQNDVRENLDFVFPSHKDDISFWQSIILLQHRSFWVSRYWGMFFSFRNDFSVQRHTDFHIIKDLSQNSGHQQGHMKHVRYQGFKNTGRHRTKCSHTGDLATGIFARYFEKERLIY
jgi:hypothetical protein